MLLHQGPSISHPPDLEPWRLTHHDEPAAWMQQLEVAAGAPLSPPTLILGLAEEAFEEVSRGPVVIGQYASSASREGFEALPPEADRGKRIVVPFLMSGSPSRSRSDSAGCCQSHGMNIRGHVAIAPNEHP
jgi:hypothetical protein